jgi:hypothetical protein
VEKVISALFLLQILREKLPTQIAIAAKTGEGRRPTAAACPHHPDFTAGRLGSGELQPAPLDQAEDASHKDQHTPQLAGSISATAAAVKPIEFSFA